MNPGTHITSLDTSGTKLDLVGGKGQSLAGMTSAGLPAGEGSRKATEQLFENAERNETFFNSIEPAPR